MKLKIYQVDAFTDTVFSGNPAAVCIIESWLDDALMQSIAAENNLAETAFAMKNGDLYELRWFTPTVEVDLCGHATLATAYVLFNELGIDGSVVNFHSHRSGELSVTREDDLLILDFPSDKWEEVEPLSELNTALGTTSAVMIKGKTDYMVICSNQKVVENMNPDFRVLAGVEARGIIVTAPGNDVDFVSRFFAPQSGIDEDPVTGSAHTTLIPYWSARLGKSKLTARQLSGRGGELWCEQLGDRVRIGGKGVLYMFGEIEL